MKTGTKIIRHKCSLKTLMKRLPKGLTREETQAAIETWWQDRR